MSPPHSLHHQRALPLHYRLVFCQALARRGHRPQDLHPRQLQSQGRPSRADPRSKSALDPRRRLQMHRGLLPLRCRTLAGRPRGQTPARARHPRGGGGRRWREGDHDRRERRAAGATDEPEQRDARIEEVGRLAPVQALAMISIPSVRNACIVTSVSIACVQCGCTLTGWLALARGSTLPARGSFIMRQTARLRPRKAAAAVHCRIGSTTERLVLKSWSP
jgi:hypothetical protein